MVEEEMRALLDEELARAVLIGDGRIVGDENKINEENIRPIAFDNENLLSSASRLRMMQQRKILLMRSSKQEVL